jgi:hypothetical protein
MTSHRLESSLNFIWTLKFSAVRCNLRNKLIRSPEAFYMYEADDLASFDLQP